jgi:hypothetical protein
MRLVRLIYASRVVNNFGANDVSAILKSSRKNNATDGLSGMLIFNSDYFIQCLEGGREMVSSAFQRICRDTRHHDVLLLDYCEVPFRQFNDWEMGYVSMLDLEKEKLFRYSTKPEINPFTMSGENALHLLLSMRSIAE